MTGKEKDYDIKFKLRMKDEKLGLETYDMWFVSKPKKSRKPTLTLLFKTYLN